MKRGGFITSITRQGAVEQRSIISIIIACEVPGTRYKMLGTPEFSKLTAILLIGCYWVLGHWVLATGC